MKKHWKMAFFILMGLNITIVLYILINLFLPIEGGTPDVADRGTNEDVGFLVTSNKSDLNKVINHYLDEEIKSGQINYDVILDHEVDLYGTLAVFGQDLQMKLSFEPQALENGDLLLKQKSMSIGRLQLPASQVMKIVRDRYALPDWVIIQPKEETVYVSLQNMELKSDIKVRANEFDLKSDNISFTLYVPAN
ncbi:YpmS family protein [Mesobacillus harenae]|uniref:YpmS family protein n=1 Tax=Mesobacillus harenae TaxID=2213203 RepID=UPI0015810117|nr:YpmS family protein [Mesobacillus harenae]